MAKSPSIFAKATNETAYAKVGLLGFQGSGKTFTAVDIALGLAAHCKSKKPIYFLDTETGSDWALPRFAAAKIELRVAKTRAFSDLLAGIKEAEEKGFALIIDSVSHYWSELMESYQRRHKLKRLSLQHWIPIKNEWREFSTAFVNSNVHIIVCGRAGWEWADEKDENGEAKLTKIGTKMKVEGEFGFEPSLLIEMIRSRDDNVAGAPVIHRGVVIKDRRMDEQGLDGKEFIDPTFADFLPHFECLNLGGKHVGVDASRSSDERFDPQTGESWESRKRRAAVLVEEFNGELEARYTGTGKDTKIAKAALKKHVFGTYSDTAIADLWPDKLKAGLADLREILEAEDWAERVEKIVAKMKKEAKKEDK